MINQYLHSNLLILIVYSQAVLLQSISMLKMRLLLRRASQLIILNLVVITFDY